MTAQTELLQQGWVKYYHCNCGGSVREYYNHPVHKGYEVRLRPTKASFTLLYQNQMIAGPLYSYKLKETLQAHGIAD